MFDIKVSAYWKGILAAIGALVVAVQAVVDDGAVTTDEWGFIITAVVTFVAVVAKRNEPAA